MTSFKNQYIIKLALSEEEVNFWNLFVTLLPKKHATDFPIYFSYYENNFIQIQQDYEAIKHNIPTRTYIENTQYYKDYVTILENIFPKGTQEKHFLMFLLTFKMNHWEFFFTENEITWNPTNEGLNEHNAGLQLALISNFMVNGTVNAIYPQMFKFPLHNLEGTLSTRFLDDNKKQEMHIVINNNDIITTCNNIKTTCNLSENSFINHYSPLGNAQKAFMQFIFYLKMDNELVVKKTNKKQHKI